MKGIPPMIRYSGLMEVRQGVPKEQLSTRTRENYSVSADEIVARYRDGSVRVIFTSIYTQFFAEALRRICEALSAAGAEEPEKEEIPEPAAFSVSGPQPEAGMAEEDLSNIIELQDENGDPVYFEFLDLIRYENGECVVLFPVDENKEPTGEDVALTGGLAMRHNRLQALHYYKYSEMKGMFYKRLYESSVFNSADIRNADQEGK